ncbi:gliding motility-associated protein GldE [Lacibacter cauensis]|uniref:Gliding motility-associated protein GldE n=1 Tax=Lacibacter cauensis TaxID=510947 RepID=A0A562SR50_9BACT|nr:gliding motility-associated protein GldE [Lacibacter cauensis]TWI83494.1 gliding motility-associated protein GldE [Lacibacter cauensis]
MDYHHAVNLLFLKPVLLAINSQLLTVLILVFLLLLFLSFVVSGAEVAFFSLRYKDLNVIKTKSDAPSRRIVNLLEEPKVLMASLLSANVIFNLGIVFLTNYLVDEGFGLQHKIFWAEMIVKALVIAAFILLFCEILPKVWASQNNTFFAYFASWWIDALVYPLFKSTGSWLAGYSDSIEKRITRHQTSSYKSEELDYAIDLMSEEEATVEEKQILKGIQNFSNITVKQVMRSRLDVSGIDYNSSFTDVIKRLQELHYSRVPVYKNNLDEIVGILQTKDLLPHVNDADGFHWQQLMRTPFFVPEHKLIDDLLKEFQQKRIHFAVVVDEFGGTSGIVTMEDVVEEIIGDIKDEFDEDESINKKIDESNYLFEGRTMVHDVCRIMNLPADTFDAVKGESESLAGLILELAERLPRVNDVLETGDFQFAVLEVSRNRIEKVKVTIKPMID